MKIKLGLTAWLMGLCLTAQAQVPEVKWDAQSLIVDGRRVCPVMGEVHYSRIPADEWADEVRKMKEGGVTVIATYVFWNHVEEQEGIFNWSGQRDLRRFIETCRQEGLPVVLRVGPFCHGEVRNGGIPDWVFTKGCKTRSEEPAFLALVEQLYRQIFTQVQGLQWKDGGPLMACQFDNEYRGHGSYLMALKRIALSVGFDLPFYTRTGWPELSSPVPFGEMIPLYGDYADGFWERSIEETAGNYYKAFNFTASQVSGAIATEQIEYKEEGGRGQLIPLFHLRTGGRDDDGISPETVCLSGGCLRDGDRETRQRVEPAGILYESHRGIGTVAQGGQEPCVRNRVLFPKTSEYFANFLIFRVHFPPNWSTKYPDPGVLTKNRLKK